MLLFLKKISFNLVKFLSLMLKYVAFVLFVQLQMLYPIYATVNIAIINKAGSNTNRLNSANGIPVINIDKVNSKGQSFNEYDYFNVGREGLIFNNSAKNSSTELAGWIAGNSNLKENQSANLIVNTVRSKRSELMGYMEVAGNKADVVILNQKGIVCDGCGFLNTNNAILSTGKAILNNGNFSGIGVSKGEIEIGRGGLNAEKANRIDIISQKLRLNGQLRGKDVNVSLGGQNYDYATKKSVASDSNNNELYVISSSEFGGMYGDSIRLISHNKSLGVNIDFNMGTSGSNIEVDSAGNLTISSKVSSSKDINIKAKNINILNNANLYSKSNTYLKGNDLYLDKTSEITSSGNLNFNTNSLLLSGKILSLENLELNSKDINVKGANIEALNIDIFSNSLNIEANSLLNASNQFQIKLTKDLNIYSGVQIGSVGDFIIDVNDLNIHSGGKLSSDSNLKIDANDVFVGKGNSVSKTDNENTYLSGNKGLIINAKGNIEVQAKGNLTTKGDMWLYSDNLINRGFIAGNNLNFRVWDLKNLGAERIGNSHNSYSNMGVIYSTNNIDIKGKDGSKAKKILNSSAKIQAKNGNIDILSQNFENTLSWWEFIEHISDWKTIYEDKEKNNSGWIDKDKKHREKKIEYETLLEQYINYELFGSESAILSAGGKININADNFVNRESNISSVGDININAGNFTNESIYKTNRVERKVITTTVTKKEKYCGFWDKCGWSNWFEGWLPDGNDHVDKIEKKETVYGKKNILNNGSLISSANNITIDAKNDFNNGSIKEHTNVENDKGINWNINSGANGLLDIDGNMFYEGDGTSGYLIETNPYFTDLQNFKGSEYYLGLLGLYPSKDNPFLGDGFVDLEVVTKQILDKTGKEVLEGYKSKEEQLEELMQAGIDSKDELGLVAGQTLTDEQLANLKQPIIWWVYQEVNGQKVLVPQVFFPKDTESTFDKNQHGSNSNIVSGGKVDINAGGNVSNSGNIIAEDGININADGDVNNSGNLVNKDKSKEHQENMENINKDIEENLKEVESLGEQYNKLNDKYEINLSKFNAKEAEYNALLAKIQGMNTKYSGKVWTVDADLNDAIAKENVKLEKLGLDLQIMQDALSASGTELSKLGENINSKSENINKLSDKLENYVDNEVSGVEINSGGSINNSGTINADKVLIESKNKLNDLLGNINGNFKTNITAKEINLQGSNLNGGELNLNANDINIKAHETHDIFYANNHGLATGLIQSNLSGGNVNLNSDNNIFISSSNIIGDNILLDAKGDVTVTAQKIIKKLNEDEAKNVDIVYTDINTQQQTSGKLSDVSGARLTDAYEINNIGSNILASNSLSMKSGNDILIEGSNILSDGLLSLDAKKDITIKSLEDERHIEYEVNQSKTESSGKWYKFNRSKKTTTTHETGDMYSTINQSSNILGGTVVINADNDVTLQGANVGITEKEESEKTTEDTTSTTSTESKDDSKTKDAKIKEGSIIINAGNNFNQLAVHDSMNLTLDSKIVEKSHGFTSSSIVDNAKEAGSVWEAMSNNSGFLGKSSNDGIKALSGISNATKALGAVGKLTNLGSVGYTTTTSTTDINTNLSTTTVVSSNIFGDNISISAGNNLIVEAGNIDGKEGVSLSAKNDVVIKEAYNTMEKKQSIDNNTHTESVDVSVGLSGVNANASVSTSQTHTDSKEKSKNVVGSNISGGNISISAGNNAQLTSANVVSEGDISLSAKNDIIINSAQSTQESEYSTNTTSVSASVGVGVSFAGTPNVSGSLSVNKSQEEGNSKNVTHAQGTIAGKGNITIDAGNDFSMKGSDIVAGGDATLNANNVNIESVQDTTESHSKGSSWGVNAGFGLGDSMKLDSASVGASVGKTKTDANSVTTNKVSGIKGSGNVAVNAKGDMNLTGAVIGGQKGTNIDVAGNINITDLQDSNNYESSGFNVGYTYTHNLNTKKNQQSKESFNKTQTKIDNNESIGVIGRLSHESTRLNQWANSPLAGWSVGMDKTSNHSTTLVQGGIASNGSINAGSVNINGSVSSVDNIFSDINNNKKELSNTSESYSFQISPKETLQNTASAIDTVKTGLELGGEIGKITVKTYKALKDNGQISFKEAYDYQSNIIDKVQKESREEGINLLHNTEEYNKMLVDTGILDEDLQTVIYADGKEIGAGYSHKEKSEIGLDLLSGNSLTSSSDLENTYWHEVTHQSDTTNITEEDREKYATNMGNSAESLGNINNWLYGDGGLNDYTLTNYFLNNYDALQNNNNYVHSLDKNLLENKAYIGARNLNNDFLAKLNINHQFILITGTEKQLNGYIKEYNISNNLLGLKDIKKDAEKVKVEAITLEMEKIGVEKTKEDTHYIILGGYKGGTHTNAKKDGSEDGKLIKDIGSPDDNNYVKKGYFYNKKIDFEIKDDDKNNRDLIETYLSYNNSANYPITGVPNDEYYISITGSYKLPESSQTYNSNSFAYSICSYSGGNNCDYDFKGSAPGSWKLIPNIYFSNKNQDYK